MKRQWLILLFNTLMIIALCMAGLIASAFTASENRRELDNEWAFFLIDTENPLPEDYTIDLKAVYGAFSLDARCADYAIQMIDDAWRDGIDLCVVSAYRDSLKQAENYSNYVRRLIAEGHTAEEAYKITATEIAPAGASEHNAGLALDILTCDWWSRHDDIDETFAHTDESKWLEENAWKYGFIMSYPEGKEGITGYVYEPWHYRFVGLYRAKEIFELGLTLTEYMEHIEVNGE